MVTDAPIVLLDDVLALPNLEELDLGRLPGLGRLGADAHADVESLTILRQLAESQPRSPRVRLRVRGRHDTPLEELLHLAARNVAAENLRGSAGLALDGPGAATPPRPVGSSFLPEQQQLAAAQQLQVMCFGQFTFAYLIVLYVQSFYGIKALSRYANRSRSECEERLRKLKVGLKLP